MAASVTATSVLPVPPKPEPTVITPDFSDGARIAAILWRRHSAAASRLARSRPPGVRISPCLDARLDPAHPAPSDAGARPPAEDGDDVAQEGLSLPGNPVHHAPSWSGYSDIAPFQVRVPV